MSFWFYFVNNIQPRSRHKSSNTSFIRSDLQNITEQYREYWRKKKYWNMRKYFLPNADQRIWKELRDTIRKINEGNTIVLPEFIQQMLEINGVSEVCEKKQLLSIWFQFFYFRAQLGLVQNMNGFSPEPKLLSRNKNGMCRCSRTPL